MFETMTLSSGGERRTRDSEATRARLLHCAFAEIYEHGYAGASLDRILADSGVTKGALYHHFGSKAELAQAVIDEVIRPWLVGQWLGPLTETDDPIPALRATLEKSVSEMTERELACGCPLNNLAQELANAGDDAFREHLERVFVQWRGGIAEALERGKTAGTVRDDVDSAATAAFLVACFEGMAGTAKSSRDRALARSVAGVMIQFLETLRPSSATAPIEIAKPPTS